MKLSNVEFDRLVRTAIDSIDPEFRPYFNEVPVVVEDLPDDVVCRETHLKDRRTLLGLLRGIPLTRQGRTGAGPHQIILYRRNILNRCNSQDQLAAQIRSTLIHELGHYVGFSESQLRRLTRPEPSE